MVYKITLKMDLDNEGLKELEDLMDKFGIDFEVNEVYETEV